jgi:asparagine synthase (glutamine-hydrolysing)
VPVLRQARRFLGASSREFAETYRDWLTYLPQSELQDLLTPAVLRAVTGTADGRLLHDLGTTEATLRSLDPGTDPIDAACLADIEGFLPHNVLRESDRVSMRHALEVRVPYADRRVLDFGLRLPPRFKLSPWAAIRSGGRGGSKRVLREVAARYLPDAVVKAPKQGFGAPMGAWLAGPLRELLERATRTDVLEQRGIVRPERVAAMRAEHLAGTRDRTWNLWALVVLESWFEQRVDRPVPTQDAPDFPVHLLTAVPRD